MQGQREHLPRPAQPSAHHPHRRTRRPATAIEVTRIRLRPSPARPDLAVDTSPACAVLTGVTVLQPNARTQKLIQSLLELDETMRMDE